MTLKLVECYSGSEYAERPVALYWEGERLEIEEMIDRQRTPQGINFRVRTVNGSYFELFYDQFDDQWTIQG
jgi:hypothetical protein